MRSEVRQTLTLKMVTSSWDAGVWRVACFQGIWKRRWSWLTHCSPGYLPLLTCASNQGFRRILRGWKLMVRTCGSGVAAWQTCALKPAACVHVESPKQHKS